jgi:hypothetical protein
MRAPTIFVLGFFVAVLFGNSQPLSAVSDRPQTVSEGGVTVKVTYLEQTDHESRFSVALDTHSVDLDAYDLKALSFIRDDTGLTMKPTGAENKGSGHHRQVILTFPRPSTTENGWNSSSKYRRRKRAAVPLV